MNISIFVSSLVTNLLTLHDLLWKESSNAWHVTELIGVVIFPFMCFRLQILKFQLVSMRTCNDTFGGPFNKSMPAGFWLLAVALEGIKSCCCCCRCNSLLWHCWMYLALVIILDWFWTANWVFEVPTVYCARGGIGPVILGCMTTRAVPRCE